jgi:hypothetical protein
LTRIAGFISNYQIFDPKLELLHETGGNYSY